MSGIALGPGDATLKGWLVLTFNELPSSRRYRQLNRYLKSDAEFSISALLTFWDR